MMKKRTLNYLKPCPTGAIAIALMDIAGMAMEAMVRK
jgi:hypothetical protein